METTQHPFGALWVFFEAIPDQAQVEEHLVAMQLRAEAWFAKLDEQSARASMWTRDPLGALPKARLLLLDNTPFSAATLSALNARLGSTPYLSTTRSPLPLALNPGETYPGTLQLCCFRRVEGLSDAALRERWLTEHTPIAIDTQDTEGYRQHWVTQPAEPAFDGIVEEYFPASASQSPEHFFAAVGDSERLKENIKAITRSSQRFLDLDQSEVIHLTDTRLL